MNIGIIGHGVVGKAIAEGFENLGNKIFVHDIKYKTTIENISNTDVVFICVPSPIAENGSCDTSIIEKIFLDLNELNYKGVVAVKTTVWPGFTVSMQNKYPTLEICFVPEFLRERCAYEDFTENHMLLAVGTENANTFNFIKILHSFYPTNCVMLSPTEAEILKYYNNIFATVKITFANLMYELCEHYGCNYTKIKDAFILTNKTKDLYLDVNNSLRGFSGPCLPKDIEAIAFLLQVLQKDYQFFSAIIHDNKKFKPTVFPGMRLT